MRGTTHTSDHRPVRDRWRRMSIRHATVVAYLALFMALSGTAVAATGGNFILGQKNSAGGVTTLTSSSGAALSLRSPSGVAPLHVNRSVRVDRLNADLLDGLDSTGFARLGKNNSGARTTLANPSGTPLRLAPASGIAPLEVTSNVKVGNLNADLLDGRDSTEFLTTKDFTDINAQYQALKKQHETLQAQYATLQGQFEALQGEYAGVDDRIAALEALLVGASRTNVNGYDTLRLSGVNLQVVNGTGSTMSGNGLGNLLVGYSKDHASTTRTGSHNVVVGDGHGWTSNSGVIAGFGHRANGLGASLIGGANNTANGPNSAVFGGSGNKTIGGYSTVTGGMSNTATFDPNQWITGSDYTSISGGTYNTASGYASSILGGHKQTATENHECKPGC